VRSEYADEVKDRSTKDWEELADREPYFAVLTSDGACEVEGNRFGSEAFFESGEADVSALLAAITLLVGHEIALTDSLDFGCGVGRLTLPLARRAERVVGYDVAPTMLTHARQNAESAGLRNVTFVDTLEYEPPGQFDFVCSLLVFQHIEPRIGYRLIQKILTLLAPSGIAALHLMLGQEQSTLRQMARWIRRKSALKRTTNSVSRSKKLIKTRASTNEYHERAVIRHAEAVDAHLVGRFPTRDGSGSGAVLIIQKASSIRIP
jgi:cyclopropane fatty-acyl-phospholipid synthase-like methyltransferase